MNRVESDKFPNDVCSVIAQGSEKPNRCQFSYMCDGKPEIFYESIPLLYATLIAYDVLDNNENIYANGAMYYHANYVEPSWAKSMEVVAVIGDHVFLRE